MMRIFTKKQLVATDSKIIERASAFSTKVVKTVNYRDSNQTNLKKIENDHFISKIGEEAVRAVFEKFGKQVKGPDYRIYEGRRKSWDEDLYIDDLGLAVKTQKETAARRYGLSWTFQASGYRNDPILKKPGAWVCFVLCRDGDRRYDCEVFPPFQIGELKFSEPKLLHLRGKKKVVYVNDFPKI